MPAPLTAPCPQCRRAASLAAGNPHRPFCSERCKLIDLGAWAAGRYGIPAQDQPPEAERDDEPRLQ